MEIYMLILNSYSLGKVIAEAEARAQNAANISNFHVATKNILNPTSAVITVLAAAGIETKRASDTHRSISTRTVLVAPTVGLPMIVPRRNPIKTKEVDTGHVQGLVKVVATRIVIAIEDDHGDR